MDLPLFEEATRRAVLRTGLAATGVLFANAFLTACGGNGDKSAFGSATTGGASATTARGSTTTAGGSATSPATTRAGTTTSTTRASSSTAASGLVSVAFTYTASDAGRVNNPFIAAWVEDATSSMVALIGVVYLARESKYLRELTEWAAAATKLTTSQLDAVSGATRAAGAYSFQWNGKGLDGKVLQGPYSLWVEAAREHGPHSVTHGSVTLGAPGKATIPGSGELSSATVNIA